ncbi:MAG: metal-sulfur cluster assembly factor [Planctomycetota bacterium]
MVTKEQVVQVIKTVYDPEIPVNVYDLGLIYTIDLQGEDKCTVKMTLTSQGCPSAQSIPLSVKDRIQRLGLNDVTVDVVWDPAWGPHLISPEGKRILGLE